MSAELDTTYNPTSVEKNVSERWDEANAFRATPDDRARDKRFVVMIPLPNVTGQLHLGHAINNTLQDVVTRYHRMRGFNCLYQPGTDHAGIATQAVVEKRIFEEEGKSRHDLGREELVRRIWEWKERFEKRILGQLKSMGCSCDWERVRFTLDDKYSAAVHETFFKWFSDGLIFRGERLVNWDTHLQTAVADDEVYHITVKGHFWHFKYPLKDPSAGGVTHLSFATTRPETMLADVALAVNPKDERYQALVGKTVLVPLFDPPREIPIVADAWADPEKGTGCVKITPAHDANDYEVGRRCNLPMINVMTVDGKVNDNGGEFAGLSFPEARKQVVAKMEALELLDKIDKLDVDLPHSDRSKTPIEPLLSPQWFVRMGDVDGGVTLGDESKTPGLAQSAIDAVQDARVQIFPERYSKSYVDWLSEKRDWCISRQLWWGHQIPVWSRSVADEDTQRRVANGIGDAIGAVERHAVHTELTPVGEYTVAVCLGGENLAAIETLEKDGFVRDPDVLDTWFSSQLWPFATLGWPEETADVDYFYPGTVLITSRDIISLWVARMVLSGLYNRGEVPFRHVYIHPKILDGRGETMSKSKGNGVDPLDIIDVYGADAMRYSMADMCTETQDVRMPVEYRCPHCEALTPQTVKNMQAMTVDCKECNKTFATQWADEAVLAEHVRGRTVSDKFEIGRNFCNKLWNAARFAFLNIEGASCTPLDIASLPTEDRWILAKLSETTRGLHVELGRYHFSAAIKLLRDFFWDNLCDWYIELTKARLAGGEKGAEAKQILAFCLDQILRLLHPFTPYISERLWSTLNEIAPERGLPGVAELSGSELLIHAEYPPIEGYAGLDDADILGVFAGLQEATRAIRELRNKNGIAPRQSVNVTINAPAADVPALTEQGGIIQRLANIEALVVATDAERPANSGTAVVGQLQVFVHDIGDDAAEHARLSKELVEVENQIASKEKKLSNEGFTKNAKADVVEAERGRLAALIDTRETIQKSLNLLR